MLLFAVIDASFNMLGVPAFPKQVIRGAIVIAAVAVYSVRQQGARRMTIALPRQPTAGRSFADLARRLNVGVVIFVVLFAAVALQAAFLYRAGRLHELPAPRRAARDPGRRARSS